MFYIYRAISDFYYYQLHRELARKSKTNTLAIALNLKATSAFSKMIHAKGGV